MALDWYNYVKCNFLFVVVVIIIVMPFSNQILPFYFMLLLIEFFNIFYLHTWHRFHSKILLFLLELSHLVIGIQSQNISIAGNICNFHNCNGKSSAIYERFYAAIMVLWWENHNNLLVLRWEAIHLTVSTTIISNEDFRPDCKSLSVENCM